eukprot:10216793-Ditylum_brightwellii.AAC.1
MMQKQWKVVDMYFHWLKLWEEHQQCCFKWEKGSHNKADYFFKYHLPADCKYICTEHVVQNMEIYMPDLQLKLTTAVLQLNASIVTIAENILHSSVAHKGVLKFIQDSNITWMLETHVEAR